MPVEFLTDEQAGAYEGFVGVPELAVLQRFFFLDDEDLALVARRRGDRNRLGFALQLVTVRFLGRFLDDPLDVPWPVVEFVAAQLAISDPSCVKGYVQRRQTHFEHVWEITEVFGFRDFSVVQAEVEEWVAAQAWSTSAGPKALFDDVVAWLRTQRVLVPGVSTLARLVARVREEANQRVWATLAGGIGADRVQVLVGLLEVPDGERQSTLERLRSGPTQPTGKGMAGALARVGEISALGFTGFDVSLVPHGKVVAAARYGMLAKASLLGRHPQQRLVATLLATVSRLEAQAIDDALELFDVLMANQLLGPVRRSADREHLKLYPRLTRDSAVLAAAVGVLLDVDGAGQPADLAGLWERIEAQVSRPRLRAAMVAVNELVPELGMDPDADLRVGLLAKFATVRPFVAVLCENITFEATLQATPVLNAMKAAGAAAGTPRNLSIGDCRKFSMFVGLMVC